MMKLISAQQLAKILGVPPVTVYAWVRRGILPYVRMERCIRFDEAEIQAWIDARRKPRAESRV